MGFEFTPSAGRSRGVAVRIAAGKIRDLRMDRVGG